jgi:hypothetical protein
MLNTVLRVLRWMTMMLWLGASLSSVAEQAQARCEEFKPVTAPGYLPQQPTNLMRCEMISPEDGLPIIWTERQERKTITIILTTLASVSTPVWRLNDWWRLVQSISELAASAAQSNALRPAPRSAKKDAAKVRGAYWQTASSTSRRPTLRSARSFA